MDLRTLFRVLFRRWYVVLPILTLTAVAAQQLTKSIEPEYAASGSVILLSPAVRTIPGEEELELRNPYADLSESLRTTAIALQRVLLDISTLRTLSERGFEAEYEISVDPDAPILLLSATADEPADATASLNAMADQVAEELETLQVSAGAPLERRITAENLTIASDASERNTDFYRALASIVGLGLATAIVVALAVESWMSSPARRRRPVPAMAPLGAERFTVISAAPPRPQLDPAGATNGPAAEAPAPPADARPPAAPQPPASGDGDRHGAAHRAGADRPRAGAVTSTARDSDAAGRTVSAEPRRAAHGPSSAKNGRRPPTYSKQRVLFDRIADAVERWDKRNK